MKMNGGLSRFVDVCDPFENKIVIWKHSNFHFLNQTIQYGKKEREYN